MPCKNTFVQNLNRKSPLHKVSRRKVLWKFCGRNRENDLGEAIIKIGRSVASNHCRVTKCHRYGGGYVRGKKCGPCYLESLMLINDVLLNGGENIGETK